MRALVGTMRAELIGAAGVVERNFYLFKRYILWDVAFFVVDRREHADDRLHRRGHRGHGRRSSTSSRRPRRC